MSVSESRTSRVESVRVYVQMESLPVQMPHETVRVAHAFVYTALTVVVVVG